MRRILLLAALLAMPLAHAQTKPADKKMADMQAALEREAHVAYAAFVQTCSTQYPALASKIAANWNEQLETQSDDIRAYRKTPQFSQSLRQYAKEQADEAKSPENKKMQQAMCEKLAK